MTTKTVIISHFAIPFKGIASWTNRFSYFVKKYNGSINYIICNDKNIDTTPVNARHLIVKEPKYFRYKLEKFIKYYRFKVYWNKLKILLKKEDKLIVFIIDNPGLLKTIDYYSKKENMRHRIKIIFFLHGYHYFMKHSETEEFYTMIDDLILISKASYNFQISNVNSIPCEVSIIYNGIDSNKFKKVSHVERKEIRKNLILNENKIYFLWLSQDRPKKGLHIILRAWRELIKDYPDIELLIIGTHHEVKGRQVKCLGRIPNSELPKYYQAVDFYLFPTLWHEGFGLSLAEAMKCGSVCIASNIDPVPEVMGYGKYGRLVDFPHNPKSWVEAIKEEIKKYQDNNKANQYQKNIPEKIYDLDVWCKNIDTLIDKWKNYLSE